jgi:cytochrome c-type biogenesis protein
MSDLLITSTVLASFVGGMLALLAPCCISVMLPAYFASTFSRRTQIVAMTMVFTAGVGTVILPIALGASALSSLLLGQHAWIFGVGGALMALAGFAMVAGWKFSLPMPGGGASGGGGVRGVYGLGVFAGAASACCAPVLLGVAALSGAAASFPVALAVGVAYVFGMVAPLVLIALLWDRRDWSASRLQARTIAVPFGSTRRAVPLGNVLSGGLLVLMGALTSLLAVSGNAMDTADWQVRAGAWLQHVAAVVLDALSWLPGWVGALLVFGALALIVTVAVRQSSSSGRTGAAARPSNETASDAADDDADDDAAALAPSSPASAPHPMEIP